MASPTPPPVSLEIGGRELELTFKMGALCDAEAMSAHNLMWDAFETMDFRTLRAIIFCTPGSITLTSSSNGWTSTLARKTTLRCLR